MSSSNLCHGCLSSDRKLEPLEKHEKLYQLLLLNKSKNRSKAGLQFCWECRGILETIHKFRLRITEAQKLLHTTPLPHCDSLSVFASVTKVDDFTTIINEEIKEEKPLEIEEEVKPVKEENLDDDIDNDIGIHNDIGINNDIGIDNDIEETKYFSYIPKEEIKSEDEFDSKNDDLKKKVVEVSDLKPKKDVKVGRWGKGVLPMKYRTIISADIKDKRKLYDKVKIDHATVMQLMENKKQMTSRKMFQCGRCYCGFAQQSQLEYHMKVRHAKSLGRHECDICGFRAPTVALMSAHISGHYTRYVCKLCNEGFSLRSDVYSHYKHAHRKINECKQCGMRFDCRRRDLFFKHHRELHEKFICDFCGAKRLQRKSLIRHIRFRHCDYYCKKCDQSFTSQDGWDKHNKRKHDVDVSEHNYCVECNKQFVNKLKYNEHLKHSVRHRANPAIPCPDCGKIYTKRSNMKNHYNLVHRKETKHYCLPCDTYYLNGFRLRYHQKYFHEKRPKKKDKMCTYCGKGFSTRRILENHVRTHTGERPFACARARCAAAFAQKQALAAHVKAHK